MNDDGGLKLPKNLGAPARTPVNTAVHARWNTFDAVEAEVRSLGLDDGLKPGAGMFPNLTVEDLTTTDTASYTARYVEFLAWWRYTSENFARIRAMALQTENEMEDLELETKKDMRATEGDRKKATKEEMEVSIGTIPRYRELKLLLQRTNQARILMETRLEYLERSLRLISRQVEIRKLDIEQGKTENNMPGRGRPPFGVGGGRGLPPIGGGGRGPMG